MRAPWNSSSAVPDATDHGRILQLQDADIDRNFFIQLQRDLPRNDASKYQPTTCR